MTTSPQREAAVTLYRCDVCNVFEYDTDRGNSLTNVKPGTEPQDFPGDWTCPICASDRTHLRPVAGPAFGSLHEIPCPECGASISVSVTPKEPQATTGYLAPWERFSDRTEIYMADIHTIASTGESIIEPMRTTKPVISWDDILIKGAQLARIPKNSTVPVNTRTVIGLRARQPLVIETPVYVTHMSFGALSREVKIALSKGSAAVQTAIGSGEGGILPEEQENAYRYIFEYVPNRYSVTEESLRRADAIEIKIGQSAEPGMGARLPADKVTAEIARVR